MRPSRLAARSNERYFGNAVHPCATFEDAVRRHLGPERTLRDAGCGHGVPVLPRFADAAKKLIGGDCTYSDRPIDGITRLKRDLANIRLHAQSVDVFVSSSSVTEHIAGPVACMEI